MSAEAHILLHTLETNRPGLIRFLSRRLGDEDAAHDVLQSLSETLLSKPVSRDVHNPRAYLYKAAANAATSHLRARNTRENYEMATFQQSEPVDQLTPERVLMGQDALNAAQSALDELPQLTKRMFLLFRVHGVPQKEIAKRFGVSLSTVEKRIAKAVSHCHARLRSADITDVADDRRLINKQGKEQSDD